MNAGRGLERLIADWLVEEAPGRAPDRILDGAGRVIDTTRQRRFVAEWREPMYVTLRGLVAAAAVIVVVVAGVAYMARGSTTGTNHSTQTPAVTASPVPSASADAEAQLAAYRAARDAVCKPAMQQLLALFAALPSGASTAEQAAILDQNIALAQDEIGALAAIEAPPLLADEHAIDVQRHRDGLVMIQAIAGYLHDGKQAEANAVDQAVAGLSSLEEAFEAKYALAPCP